MKKLINFLLPFVCLNIGLLSSCGKDNKIQLSFGDLNTTDVDATITIGDLNSKKENKESFLLTIADTGCYCWNEFHPVIKSYITNNHLYCAFMTYDNFKDYASNFNITLTKGTTKFVIFQNGEAKIQIQSSSEDKTMRDLETFNKFMDGNVYLPKAYFIKEENYATVTANGAVIYFERSQCGDCTYLNPTVLAKYISNHKDMKNIYVLDCQPWKSLSSEEYQAKKDNYGLSNKNNTKYGFDNGVFPFFSYIKNNEYVSGAVAFNDTVEKQNGEYVITNSYYTEERLNNLNYLNNVSQKVIKGLKLPSSDVSDNGEYISWMHDKAVKYYEPIINGFLDAYLPQVGFTL